MNRIGRIASGGIIDSAATNGASVARISGITPVATPNTSPIAALIASAMTMRSRLAHVSSHSRISAAAPVFLDRVLLHRLRNDGRRGQQLVVRILGESQIRRDHVDERENDERQRAERPRAAASGLSIDQAPHGLTASSAIER